MLSTGGASTVGLGDVALPGSSRRAAHRGMLLEVGSQFRLAKKGGPSSMRGAAADHLAVPFRRVVVKIATKAFAGPGMGMGIARRGLQIATA
jgi:hypothetical protein